MNFKNKKLIVIVGPTGVGKTGISIRLAKHFTTEIISADSRQFFKELSIGTAKPDAEDLKQIRHYFINSHSITDDVDAAQYGNEALELINKLFKSCDYLIVCGGSGLYIKSLIEGFDDIPEVPEKVREEVEAGYDVEGLPWLQNTLKEVDPDYYKVVDLQNPARIMRALEVALATGKSITSFQKKQKRELPFSIVKIGLELERSELYKRIDDRMDKMIQAGLFDEAKELYTYRHHNALQTVGYSEIFDFLEGKTDKEETVRLLKRNSRRYAKRQLTWFKRDEEIRWFNPEQFDEILKHIENQ